MHPAWAPAQIVYQIMPDRFAIGSAHAAEAKLAMPCYQRPGMHVRRWHESPAGGSEFFGGDLDGIIERLDHLQRFGVTCVYLTPVFTSPSNHKYDTTDYFSVDPQFGGLAALRRLISALHDRGMRLILDVSLNHVSHHHPWFQQARAGVAPFNQYFTFKPDGEYLRWRDHGHMPEINLAQPVVQDELYRRPNSVLQHYLALGLDGWRLDVAPDMGLQVMADLRRALARDYTDRILIGEVMAYPGLWAGGADRYHGVMNYYFMDAVGAWLGGRVSGRQMAEAVRQSYADMGHDGAISSWNMLASHDTARLATRVPDPTLRTLARVAQFTLPGVPHVYYGEEVGMVGGADPECRRPMQWESETWNESTVSEYRALIALRAERPELQHGQFLALSHVLDTAALVFIRFTAVAHEVSLVAINPSPEPFEHHLLVPHPHLYHALRLNDVLHAGQFVTMEAGSVVVRVPPRAAAIWVPDSRQFKHYSFVKPTF